MESPSAARWREWFSLDGAPSARTHATRSQGAGALSALENIYISGAASSSSPSSPSSRDSTCFCEPSRGSETSLYHIYSTDSSLPTDRSPTKCAPAFYQLLWLDYSRPRSGQPSTILLQIWWSGNFCPPLRVSAYLCILVRNSHNEANDLRIRVVQTGLDTNTIRHLARGAARPLPKRPELYIYSRESSRRLETERRFHAGAQRIPTLEHRTARPIARTRGHAARQLVLHGPQHSQ